MRELRFKNGRPVDADDAPVACEYCDEPIERSIAVVTAWGTYCSVACADRGED